MLTFEQFEKVIGALKANHEKLDKIVSALNWVEVFDLSLCDEVVGMLENIFQDKGKWIDYWVYERDFGRDWSTGVVTEDDKPIDLSTTSKRYKFLTDNMEKTDD